MIWLWLACIDTKETPPVTSKPCVGSCATETHDSASTDTLENCGVTVPIPDQPASTTDALLNFEGPAPRSILFVVVDTFRRDDLMFYGYDRNTMPCMASHGAHIVRFDNMRATGSWTGITTAALATGLLPERHGFLRVNTTHALPENPIHDLPLAATLQAAGWATTLISGNGWVTPKTGFSEGFDSINESPGEIGHTESDILGPLARDWIRALPQGQPFFMHLQLLDNHYPYLPRPEYQDQFIQTAQYPWGTTYADQEALITSFPTLSPDEQALAMEFLRGLYDAETLAEDQELEAILVTLKEQGRLDDTLIVITADHGESIGEAGLFGHGNSLREELVSLPLWVYNPRLRPGVVPEIVRSSDLLPTLFHSLDLPLPEGLDGLIVTPGHGAPFAYGPYFPNNDRPLSIESLYVERDGIKILRDCQSTTDWVFDLKNDPEERYPLAPMDAPPAAWALQSEMEIQIAALQSGSESYTACLKNP